MYLRSTYNVIILYTPIWYVVVCYPNIYLMTSAISRKSNEKPTFHCYKLITWVLPTDLEQ